jgi:hypothetical protein
MNGALIVALVVLTACASDDSATRMDGVMKALVGRKIADVIAEKSIYPDSTDILPNGNTVYRFATGSGGSVSPNGQVTSNVCKVWLETAPDGTIVRWRYENCR